MDSLRLLSFLLDDAMGSLKGELMQLASKKIVMGGLDEGTLVEATLEVDLDAVLRSQASCRTVREVQQAEGEEDSQSTENPRN